MIEKNATTLLQQVHGESLAGWGLASKELQHDAVPSLEILSKMLADELKTWKKTGSVTFVEGYSCGVASVSFAIPGCTPVFGESFITPTATSMIALGVSPRFIDMHGIHSPETALTLIDAVQNWVEHDVVIVNTGYGTVEQSIDTLAHIACTVPRDIVQMHYPDIGPGSKDVPFAFDLPLAASMSAEVKKQFVAHAGLVLALTAIQGQPPTIPFSPSEMLVVTENNDPMSEPIALMMERGWLARTVESCTAGRIGRHLGIALEASHVVYNDEAKIRSGFPPNALEGGHQYSGMTAQLMAILDQTHIPNDGKIRVTASTTGTTTKDTRFPDVPAGVVHYAVKVNGSRPASETCTLDIALSRAEMQEVVVKEVAKLMVQEIKKSRPQELVSA